LRYADIRWTATHEQHVRVRNDEVETLSSVASISKRLRVAASK
jgi:predicted Zn-dependent protease